MHSLPRAITRSAQDPALLRCSAQAPIARWAARSSPPNYPSLSTRRSQSTRSRYTKKPTPDSRIIYIAGLGNIGKFVAHSLRSSFAAPAVTLLNDRPKYKDTWAEEGYQIRMLEYEDELVSDGYGFEIAPNALNRKPIDHLVICTKAPSTVSAVKAVSDRLHPGSSLLFFQNGIGMVEEVTREIFPDVQARPSYSLGITTHGIYSQTKWTFVHAGYGTTHLSIIPRRISHPEEPPSNPDPYDSDAAHPGKWIIDHLVGSPILTSVQLPYEQMLQFQWEKLAINAVINPITSLLSCRNGDLTQNRFALELGFKIASEVSAVVSALPELKQQPMLAERFEPNRLMDAVVDVAHRTAMNVSSMLQDVKQHRETEIEYINGFVVKRGKELGIQCPINDAMAEMVRARDYMNLIEHKDVIPLENAPRQVDAAERRREEMRQYLDPLPGKSDDNDAEVQPLSDDPESGDKKAKSPE